MREYIQIEMPPATRTTTTTTTQPYKLYKFMDRRDPRYQKQLQKLSTKDAMLSREEHCVVHHPNDNNSNDNDGVAKARNIVLYVPGHWGSYGQSRSVGAHGTQMTKARETNIRQRIQTLNDSVVETNNVPSSLDTFIYDVYSVDFMEQGTALHGQFVKYQSDFVAACIKQLVEDCSATQIYIVAHSMGGYVALYTLQKYPELHEYVQNIITLATPHSNPLYSFDRSIHEIHQSLKESKYENDTQPSPLIVSLSGGLRDEMIEASACEIVEPKNGRRQQQPAKTISVLTTRFMTTKQQRNDQQEPLLGMDHRAIVWCHQVLDDVRKILWTLVTTTNDHLSVSDRREKVERLLGIQRMTYSYSNDVHTLYETMRHTYGRWYAVCMESSMLYNLPYVFSLFVVIASIHAHIDPFHKTILTKMSEPSVGMKQRRKNENYMVFHIWPVVLVIGLGSYFNHRVDLIPTVIMALVADLINSLLVTIMPIGFLQKTMVSSTTTTTASNKPLCRLASTLLVVLVFIIVLGFSLANYLNHGVGVVGFFQRYLGMTLYIYAIVMIYIILITWIGWSSKSNTDSAFDIQFIVLTMMTIPVTVAGDITLMIWDLTTHIFSWKTILSLFLPVGLLSLTKILQSYRGDGPRNIQKSFLLWRRRSIGCFVLVFITAPWILSPGSGYLASTVVQTIAWIDLGLVYFCKYLDPH
jgi:pimeloyl-ACP methyl ester carboxylesterase